MRLEEYIKSIKDIDLSMEQEIQDKLDNLTKPVGSLGRLEEVAKQCCLIKKTITPGYEHKVIFTMAADHGVVDEGVSAYPKEVTPQMVLNFIKGGAGVNVLSKHVGARVVITDIGVESDFEEGIAGLEIRKINNGTANMAKGPAMNREEAVRSIEVGFELVEKEMKAGIDIIGTGDMGIGNTTPSSAIVSVITGSSVEEITGRGTGIDDRMLKNKIEVIKRSLDINKPDSSDAIDILSKVGGFEIGGLAGVMLAGAANGIPVVIDGFISGAAALIACSLKSEVSQYLIASHCSVERGHKIILDHLGLVPLLDLGLRLGEGTGAALGISLVEAGIKIMNEMATFKKAGVSGKNA